LGVNLHSRDLPLLQYFVQELGVGRIDPKGRDQHRLIFYKNDLVNVILPLIKFYNLKFLVYNRVNQFNLLVYI